MGSSGIQSVKCARVVLVDGSALVGQNLSQSYMPSVKQRLGIGTPLTEATPGKILDLLAGGAIIELDNGWRLATARIAGDEVVEVILNGVSANRAEPSGDWAELTAQDDRGPLGSVGCDPQQGCAPQ